MRLFVPVYKLVRSMILICCYEVASMRLILVVWALEKVKAFNFFCFGPSWTGPKA